MGYPVDPHANLAVSAIATAPSPASSGTSFVVTAGHGTRFPAPASFPSGAYNVVVWPSGQLPTVANAEIVRVTALSTDTFTITRQQESTSARSILVGDQVALAPTNKTFTDVEGAQSTVATTDATVTTLATITIPTNYTVLVKAIVVARRTGGSGGSANDGAGYEITATLKNTAGTAALIGSVNQQVVQESQAGWDCTIDVTGATARVRVTGAVNNNVDWFAVVQTYQVT